MPPLILENPPLPCIIVICLNKIFLDIKIFLNVLTRHVFMNFRLANPWIQGNLKPDISFFDILFLFQDFLGNSFYHILIVMQDFLGWFFLFSICFSRFSCYVVVDIFPLDFHDIYFSYIPVTLKDFSDNLLS